MLYQLLLAAGGVVLAALSLIKLIRTDVLAITPLHVLIGNVHLCDCLGGTMAGATVLVCSVLGFCASYSGKRVSYFIAYGLVLAAMISSVVLAFVKLRQEESASQLYAHFDRLWNEAPESTILQIQATGQCCGFDSYTDRFQEPCTEYDERVGCYEGIIRDTYLHTIHSAATPCIVLIAVLGAAFFLNLAMAVVVKRNDKQERFSVSQRQPFDAWHKAVFQ